MSRPKPRAWISSLIVGLRSRRAHGDKVEVEHRQLGQGWQGGLDADGRHVRVDADSQVVDRDFQDVAPHLGRIMGVVGQCLGIGEQQVLAMAVLERDAVAQRPDVMTEVQRAGRAVAGQDDGAFGRKVRVRGHHGLSWCQFPSKSRLWMMAMLGFAGLQNGQISLEL